MHAEVDLRLPLPGLSPVCGKPIVARFDGGQLSSDGGILLLAQVERRLGIAERLARCIEDPRAPDQIRHEVAEMIRFRALAIAAGYPDANDCDVLRKDVVFKMAVGRLPETGADLCSQPTMTRLENLPGPVALKRMMAAMVELFCDSFEQVPRRIVLDIDDTEDRVHGEQQLSLFNAYHDSRCFQPIQIYEATTGKPVAIILRPGKTPDGAEVTLVLRHVIGRIRARWAAAAILVRGDSHYGRPEAMAWCERKRTGYIFGLAGNTVLLHRVSDLAEDAVMGRISGEGDKVQVVGMAQDVLTADLVVEQVEAESRLRLRLEIQLPLKPPDTGGRLQAHCQSPILVLVESAPEVRVLPSTGITRPQQYYDPVRLPPKPTPKSRR